MKKKSASSRKDKKKQKDKDNRDSHPLNLPPEERQRLSAVMAAQEEARNSVDMEINGRLPSPTQESPATPLRTVPGAFQDETNITINGDNGDREGAKSPTPPPHRVPISVPLPEKITVDAEASKAAGNKFFKAKDYGKAISEYTKGMLVNL